ncbi:hypothetical protein ONZ43_g6369 [Nemania bipapillata]|uniref:Uncharacterized protein n=1 Tax=Nemania bipapillata TaxID=110536 RepID=A0ACC2I0X4_9PEZI|nr:hypothetical protein ONZ43_g6369 [Nemania bipapillata]
MVRTAPTRPMIEDTPTRSLRGALRPVHMFSSPRKEPRSAPGHSAHEIDRSQPPRLGTMVPYQEEPPVGHFIRPSSAASAQSRNVSSERAFALDQSDQRQTSGNSLLHAQIRNLQRQLEMRNEEILQLRRQLETQEHIDIGTLCEQLRFAKRESMMWRKRAETAEKRVAVFQRFSSKFQALKDDVDGEPQAKGKSVDGGHDESSSCSIHTENREAFNDRIKHVFAKKMKFGGGDGAVFEDEFKEASHAGPVRQFELHRGRSRRTVKLWEAAQELFDLQEGGSMRM